MIKKWNISKRGKLVLSICLLVGIIAGLLNTVILQAESEYYDNATVYDMYELSQGKQEVTMTESLDNSLGALPSSENVAVSFSMTMPEGSGNQVRMGFLTSQESGGFGSGGYLIQFYRNQTSCIRIVTLSNPETELFYQTPSTYVLKGSTVSVEIGAVNVYSDANKTNQVAVKIYVKINGTEAASAIDTAYTTRNIGKYVMAPAATSGWMGSFTVNSGQIKSKYSFDDATVYNMSKLSNGKTEEIITDAYDNSLGTLPSSENVAVSFTMTMPSGSPWQVRQGFLTTNGSSYAGYGGYLIQFYRNGEPVVRIVELDDGEKNTSASSTFSAGNTALVEIGTVNVYSDVEKTEQVAKEIYVKIQGTKVVKHLDKNFENRTLGNAVSVPTASGSFTANSGSIQSGYYMDDVTVYDMFELADGTIEKAISSEYKNSMGALPSTENVAVKFMMTKPTGLNWNVKQCFLNTTGQNYTDAGGYLVYYHYQGGNEIRITSLDGSGLYSKVPYDFAQGSTKQVEVGTVNVYSDAQKLTQVGRQVYVKIDGTVVLRHLDTDLTNDVLGAYVSTPVIDGNFQPESGKVKTTFEIKMITPEIITSGATGSGTVDTVSALVGYPVVVSVKPDNESVVEQFLVDGVEQVGALSYDATTGKYSYRIEEVTSSTSVKVRFKKSRYKDEITVYDMNDLSEGKIEASISGEYKNSLGSLPSSENVAVKFMMTMPTGLNWNLKQCFLNTTGHNYTDAGGYLVYYHYQGTNKIRITPLNGSNEFSEVTYDFGQGSTKQVEVGVVNVYEDADKKQFLGREVYVKINDSKVVTYFDTSATTENLGAYVSVPVVDGTFNKNSGNIKTTYPVKTLTPEIITAGATGTGTVETVTAVVGKPVTIYIKPSLDSTVDQLLVDGINQADKLVYDQTTGMCSYKIPTVADDTDVQVRFKQSYWFDTPTVYDMSKLENGKLEATVSTEYKNTLGKLSSSENVGVKFNFTKPTGLNWNLKQSVFNTTGHNYSEDGGYYVYYYYQGVNKLRIAKSSTEYAEIDYEFALGDTKQVEISSVNVYSDKNKSKQVGIEISVKIDGEKILSFIDFKVDKTQIGPYMCVPVVDGTLKENSGIVKTAYDYYFDKATVYDMSDLSELKVQSNISGEYKNSLGSLKTSNNVAVTFNLTKPTGLNWNLKQVFFNTTGNNYSSDGGYYIYYHYQGQNKIRIDKCGSGGTAYSEANCTFEMGKTKRVEVGRINVYSDAAKKTLVAREIYVKIDDVKVVSYLDYDLSDKTIGKFVSVPVVDGTLTPKSGNILTTYPTISITPEIITSGATGTGEVDTVLAVVGKPINISVKPAKDSTIDRFTVGGKNCLSDLVYDSESGKYVYKIKNVPETLVVKVRFHKSYWFDKADVYDMSELSEEVISASLTGNYKGSLGTVSATENVAVKFKLTKPTGLNWNLKSRFLSDSAGNYSDLTGYTIYYHYQGKEQIRISDLTDGHYSSVDYTFAQGDTKAVEIGAVNMYSDAKKETKVGRMIYVIIDGAEVVYYLDTTVKNGDVGKYVSIPVVDGTYDENSGKIVTTYRTYDIVVSDGKNVLVQKTVVEGKNYDCKIPMKKGEVISSIKLNGKGFGLQNVKQTSSHTVIPLENIRENKTFVVRILTGQKVTVSIEDTLGCQIDLPSTVQVRDELSFEIRLPIGKILKDILNNGVSIKAYILETGAVTKVRIPVVYENVNLSLVLEDTSYNVKIHASENGIIKADKLTVLAYDKLILTCSVSEGYMFEYVKVNGKEVFLQPDGTYIIDPVEEDIEVTYSVIKEMTSVGYAKVIMISGIAGVGVLLIAGAVAVLMYTKGKRGKKNE